MDQTPFLCRRACAAAISLPAARRVCSCRSPSTALAGHSKLARRHGGVGPRIRLWERASSTPTGRRRRPWHAVRAGFDASATCSTADRPQRALPAAAREGLSDLQFTSAYAAVPVQPLPSPALEAGSFLQASQGVTVTDLDGNVVHDLTAPMGVNVFGYDLPQGLHCRRRGAGHGRARARRYTPASRNVERLRAISGLDEVSFHMSGTEAVMQGTARRYHTRRTHGPLARLHGWWDDVQPGPATPCRPGTPTR